MRAAASRLCPKGHVPLHLAGPAWWEAVRVVVAVRVEEVGGPRVVHALAAPDLLNTANSHRRGDDPMTRARKMQRHMSFGHSLEERPLSAFQHDPHDGQEFPEAARRPSGPGGRHRSRFREFLTVVRVVLNVRAVLQAVPEGHVPLHLAGPRHRIVRLVSRSRRWREEVEARAGNFHALRESGDAINQFRALQHPCAFAPARDQLSANGERLNTCGKCVSTMAPVM